MNLWLAALFTLSSPTIEINEPLTVTLTLPPDVETTLPHLRGQLLSGGNFMLLEEHATPPTYVWKLEALREGTFPLSFYQVGSLYTPIEFVTVKPFQAPSTLALPSSLPLTPEIPPSLSAANQRLL